MTLNAIAVFRELCAGPHAVALSRLSAHILA